MKVQTYLLNKTHIAEDRTTGIMAYGDTADAALKKLQELVAEYWEKKRVVVPISTQTEQEPGDKQPLNKIKE